MTINPMRDALENARDALIKIGFGPEGRMLSPILAALALPSEPSDLVRRLHTCASVARNNFSPSCEKTIREAIEALSSAPAKPSEQAMRDIANTFFEHIKHGGEEHQAWLRAECEGKLVELLRRVAAPEPAQQTDTDYSENAGRDCPMCRHSAVDWHCPKCGISGVSEETLLETLNAQQTDRNAVLESKDD